MSKSVVARVTATFRVKGPPPATVLPPILSLEVPDVEVEPDALAGEWQLNVQNPNPFDCEAQFAYTPIVASGASWVSDVDPATVNVPAEGQALVTISAVLAADKTDPTAIIEIAVVLDDGQP